MSSTYKDKGTVWYFSLKDDRGNPINLNNVLKVSLILKKQNYRKEVECQFEAPLSDGIVSYTLQGTDTTPFSGLYLQQLKVEFEDGDILYSEILEEPIEDAL